MRDRKVMKLASRGKRFGAACIDSVVPFVVCLIFIITSVVEALKQYSYMQNFGFGFGAPDFGYGYGYGTGISGGAAAAFIIAFLLLLAYTVTQLILFNRSTTLGKTALGLQVVSSKRGEPIGFWKMFFREVLVKRASESVFLLGDIWILIDDKNRGWHDKILDTYVVDLRESAVLAGKHSFSNTQEQAQVSRPTPKSQPVPVQSVTSDTVSSAVNEPVNEQPIPEAAVSAEFSAEPAAEQGTETEKHDTSISLSPEEAVIPLPELTETAESIDEDEQK